MRLSFVEAAGFRGFREKLRIEFSNGFTVVSGRNGVGKSTIFDAIEFAITGGISKYRVDKAGTDKLEDYIWWRGQGDASAHYVSMSFVDDHGKTLTIRRERSGKGPPVDEIEAALCVSAGKPPNALRHMCQTSIIRDELITSLSFDLTESERFALVYAAQGVIGGPDYVSKAQEIQTTVKDATSEAERKYNDARARLNQALTDLAIVKDEASKVGDVGAALALIEREIGSDSAQIADRVARARSRLTERRVRLNAISRVTEEVRAVAEARAQLVSDEFKDEKTRVEEVKKSLEARKVQVAAELEAAKRELANQENTSAVAASLAAILEHGRRLGLHDGNCPLCNAARTKDEFEAGLRQAASRLQATGSDIGAARERVARGTKAVDETAAELGRCAASIEEIEGRAAALGKREAALLASLRSLGVAPTEPIDPQEIDQHCNQERSRLIDLERSILTLEASKAVDRVSELEARASTLRGDADTAADYLARTQRALTTAKSLDHSVRRARAEVSDERLAALRPMLNDFYQRLRPHADWKTINYSIRGDVTRLLSLRVGDDINPQFVFSSGQRRAAGLAFLFSVYLSRPWCRWKTLLLDDPVQHIDDYRSLHLVEVLAALGSSDRQIICGVEDAALADLMCRRLLGSSTTAGTRYDLERAEDGSTRVAKVTRVPPMLAGVLRQGTEVGAAG